MIYESFIKTYFDARRILRHLVANHLARERGWRRELETEPHENGEAWLLKVHLPANVSLSDFELEIERFINEREAYVVFTLYGPSLRVRK